MSEPRDLSGLASAVAGIASDPELMEKLRAAAGGLTGPAAPEEENSDSPPPARRPARSGAASDRKRLLEALRPFLSPERREKTDLLINVISLADSGVLDMLKKGGD